MTPITLLLASNSPRRREMLAWTGISYKAHACDLDESLQPGEAPGAYVARLAMSKARAAAPRAGHVNAVLGADTTVADGETLYGKPGSPDEARSMLTKLRGHAHQVYTAIALFLPDSGALFSDLCVTQVPMRRYSEREMDAYIASGDPLDKAGAYAIQNASFHPVEKFAGCFASVMGLPLCHLVRTLQQAGLRPGADVPAVCQTNLNYRCPVSTRILAGQDLG
jgi:septum formation protein